MKKSQVFKNIDECKNNKSELLDLSDLNIVTIPLEIFELVQLKSLKLTKNKIEFLPAEIENLTELEFLGLNYNQLEYLPREIGKLANLKSLDLWNNKLKSLPIEFGKLISLENLHLGFNQLDSIPKELYKVFARLKGLEIQKNPFNDFPLFNELELVELMSFFRSESSFFGYIEIPKELRIAFQQYLTFFTEFVEKSTGETIRFEVKQTQNGLKMTTLENNYVNIEQINSLLKQYVNFLRQDISETNENVKKDFLILKINEQKKHFESQLKFLEFENKYLKEKFDKVLDSHLELSSNTVKLISSVSEERILQSLKKELEKLKGNEYELLENEIQDIEPLLTDKEKNKKELKNRFKTVYDLLVGMSGSSISTGLIELIKIFL